MLKLLTVALAAFLALTVLATPAQAATSVKPVTITATSNCVNYQWEVTLVVTSIKDRVVDYRSNSDYGEDRVVYNVDGVAQLGVALKANVSRKTVVKPGASAQYMEFNIYPAGGDPAVVDPIAGATARDPIQYDPHATC